MAILTEKEIEQYAKDPSIKLIGDNYLHDNIQGASYDLRIGTVYKDEKIINDSKKKEVLKLNPSEIVTILTLEEVNIPTNICATVFPINSKSSAGLLILNPGHIDPGFSGPISICAINLSKETKYLSIGEDIFTIIFEELIATTSGYDNNFKGSRSDYEKKFLKERSSKLSPSFFDLLRLHKFEDHLTGLIGNVLNKKIAFWVPILGLIFTAIFFFRSSPIRKNKELQSQIEVTQQLLHETTKDLQMSRDSIAELGNLLNEHQKEKNSYE